MLLRLKRSSAGRLPWPGIVVATILIASGSDAFAVGLFDVPPPSTRSITNGLGGGADLGSGPVGKGLTVGQAMLWKYTARCALRPDQELQAPDAATGKMLKFRGMLGIAPEWHDGTCNADCQEKVSSCLLALTNRTGKHVEVSLLSAAPGMNKGLLPDSHDVEYPHQEGAFFGSVFAGVAYACHGRDVAKAPQVKRFCALDPTSCSGGVATFTDAGACDDVCETVCARLPDGSERCAATGCKDPTGHTWRFPITTYLRNKIEAVNADELANVAVQGDVLTEWKAGATLTYASVDFGTARHGGILIFSAGWAAKQTGGRLEIWLDGARRLGALELKNTGVAVRGQSTRLTADGVTGPHDLVLKVIGAPRQGHLSTIELR